MRATTIIWMSKVIKRNPRILRGETHSVYIVCVCVCENWRKRTIRILHSFVFVDKTKTTARSQRSRMIRLESCVYNGFKRGRIAKLIFFKVFYRLTSPITTVDVRKLYRENVNCTVREKKKYNAGDLRDFRDLICHRMFDT